MWCNRTKCVVALWDISARFEHSLTGRVIVIGSPTLTSKVINSFNFNGFAKYELIVPYAFFSHNRTVHFYLFNWFQTTFFAIIWIIICSFWTRLLAGLIFCLIALTFLPHNGQTGEPRGNSVSVHFSYNFTRI